MQLELNYVYYNGIRPTCCCRCCCSPAVKAVSVSSILSNINAQSLLGLFCDISMDT